MIEKKRAESFMICHEQNKKEPKDVFQRVAASRTCLFGIYLIDAKR